MVPYHTCMPRNHVVYTSHGICLTGWIEACIWDRYTPEQESFGVYMMIKSSRSWVFTLSRDFPLLLQSFRPFFFVFRWKEWLKVSPCIWSQITPNSNAVLIARTRKQLNVATILMCFFKPYMPQLKVCYMFNLYFRWPGTCWHKLRDRATGRLRPNSSCKAKILTIYNIFPCNNM